MWALVSLGTVTACTNPTFEGPQIQDPPERFFFDANSTQARNVFPDRDLVRQGAWWSNISDDDENSTIFITTYRGDATADDVVAARKAQADRYSSYLRYGEVEFLRIDGRNAWGWLETQGREGNVSSLEFKAVIPYDTITYVVEFHSSEPRFMEPDTLRAVVGTFAIGRREWNLPLILLIVVVGGVLGVVVAGRVRGGGAARISLCLAAPLMLAPSLDSRAQDSPTAVVGIWKTATEDDGEWSRVEIFPCEDRYCGKIVWLSEPLVTEQEDPDRAGDVKLDVNNPDEELRGRGILGLELMHSFRYDDGKWKDGRIYDPKNGKEYRCELKLTEDGEVLEVRGFIKVAFVKLGRTTAWTRYAQEEDSTR